MKRITFFVAIILCLCIITAYNTGITPSEQSLTDISDNSVYTSNNETSKGSKLEESIPEVSQVLTADDISFFIEEYLMTCVVDYSNTYILANFYNEKNIPFSIDASYKLEVYKNNEWQQIEFKEDYNVNNENIITKKNKEININAIKINFADLKIDDYLNKYRFVKEVLGKTFYIEFELTKDNYFTLDNYVEFFMNLLIDKDKDLQQFCQHISATDLGAYSFFNDIEFQSYTIKSKTIEGSFRKRFIVELDIVSSNSNYFPVGKQDWIIEVEENVYNRINLFKPINSNVESRNHAPLSDKAEFCYKYSMLFNNYSTISDFNTIVPLYSDTSDFQNFCNMLVLLFNKGDYIEPYSRQKIEEYSEKCLGITGVDFTKCTDYNAENDTVSKHIGYGYWKYCYVRSEKLDERTGIYSIVIDYYSDSLLLMKAKTVEYKLKINKDGSYRLLSTELQYDSGYRVAGGST